MMRTYSELCRIHSFDERFRYLELRGAVGRETFGYDRYFNQQFYNSYEWRHIRDEVIIRDCGCDLGVKGYDIVGRILIHHMNPVRPEDIQDNIEVLLDPEYLICVSHETHNALHYGSEEYLRGKNLVERMPNDTCPWRR